MITCIVNFSLSTGIFPSGAHSAIIKPLLKKASLNKNELKNYRSVSNITFIGKLFEKIACARLTEHMAKLNFADMNQSAYRACHSAESALIKVKNDLMMSINNRQVVLLVLLDLSAAFDTIDHEILLSRLVGSMQECRKCILVILQEKPFYAQNSFVFPCFLTSYFCSKIVISLSWDLV